MHEWWAKRLLEAEVEHFPMHELKHTAGTEFHRANKDLKKTQLFMRHRSITTTADVYVHLDREELEEAMRIAYLRWQELGAERRQTKCRIARGLEAPSGFEPLYEALQASA
jgi:site-specific recombinase XerC